MTPIQKAEQAITESTPVALSIIVLLAVGLVLAGIAYGTLNEKVEQNETRLQAVEQMRQDIGDIKAAIMVIQEQFKHSPDNSNSRN